MNITLGIQNYTQTFEQLCPLQTELYTRMVYAYAGLFFIMGFIILIVWYIMNNRLQKEIFKNEELLKCVCPKDKDKICPYIENK